jgi:hypothetical protein
MSDPPGKIKKVLASKLEERVSVLGKKNQR